MLREKHIIEGLQFLFILFLSLGIQSCKKDTSNQFSEPSGWFISGNRTQNYLIGVDRSNAWHGRQCGFIQSVADTSTGFCTMMQFCSEKKFSGRRIKMTGYIKSEGSDMTRSYMWIRVDDYEQQITADFDNMYDRPVSGTQPWTNCTIVFDVPESTCVINYGIILSGVGKAWFDNVSFEVVDSAIEKTAINLDFHFPYEAQLPQNLPSDPVNLDFEE